MDTPRVSVVICTRNRPDDLGLCLKSLQNQTVQPHEVIVVDDDLESHSAQSVTEEYVQQQIINIAYLSTSPDIKWPQTRNIGIEAASGNIIAFVDDDVSLPPNWLEEILKGYSENEDVAGVGGLVIDMGVISRHFLYRMYSALRQALFSGKMGKLSFIGFPYATINVITDGYRDVDYLQGCNMTFRSSNFKQYRFEKVYEGTGYADELDFCTVLRNQGHTLIFNPRAVAIHSCTPSGGARRPDRLYWLFRNHTLFLMRHFDKKYLRITILWILVSIYSLVTFKPVYLKGIADGVKKYRESQKNHG